jgi:hypothetical protein
MRINEAPTFECREGSIATMDPGLLTVLEGGTLFSPNWFIHLNFLEVGLQVS